ncbi:MAG TPA: transposase [Planctomycetaceae bacterium]|jgi:REP element-mobilizing transposase RayT
MIHGYHVIFGAYGFWLPNDPRGSWSDFVGKWELVRFGRTTKSVERRELTPEEEQQRIKAKRALKYPPMQFTGDQARDIGRAFGKIAARNNYTIWACSILPEHAHLVIARHTYQVESIVTLLKGESTRELIQSGSHPLAMHAKRGSRPPKMWSRGEWKVYLDSNQAIENAMRYVEENPEQDGKPKQKWRFVSPFRGIEPGWVTYH